MDLDTEFGVLFVRLLLVDWVYDNAGLGLNVGVHWYEESFEWYVLYIVFDVFQFNNCLLCLICGVFDSNESNKE